MILECLRWSYRYIIQIQIYQNTDLATIYLPSVDMDMDVIVSVEVDVKALVQLVIVADVVIFVGAIQKKNTTKFY